MIVWGVDLYLSKIHIENYRSIKELDLDFKKGKNVIVGKNNSGKSNIIKAIDLLLGEKSPTWNKSNNITDNDFFEGNTDEDIFIWCEIIKNDEEHVDLSNFKGAFFKIKNKRGNHVKTNIDFNDKNSFLYYMSEDFAAELNKGYESKYKKEWIGDKPYCIRSCEEELENYGHFAFAFFCKKDEDGNYVKEMTFFYKQTNESDWYVCMNANLRNTFLQSAIVPSFRDPKSQLRIANYTWYGKLLKECIPNENPELDYAFECVKEASNKVFGDLQNRICSGNTQIAFPNTTISFQFNPDTRQDIYKSTLIYVNDGFNTKLEDKGSGIQSSVIISLFDYYVRNVAHTNGSLLAIEEPELYLHPHGRRVISDKLDHFLDDNKNQVIITTHSPEFVCTPDDSINLIVVKKDGNKSVATNFYFDDIKSKQILIKKQNSEMFFADAVILVEGADKYILEYIAREIGQRLECEDGKLGKNWMNEYNVSVISCGGKHEFWKYANVLKSINIPYLVISDFDFFRDGLDTYFNKTGFVEQKEKLGELKSQVIETIRNEDEIKNIPNICEEIINDISSENLDNAKKRSKEIFDIIKKNNGTYKRLDDIKNESVKKEIEQYLVKLRELNIFILTGELEHFYTTEPRKSKEQGVLEIIKKCEDKYISEFVDVEEFKEALIVFLESCLQLNLKEESDVHEM
ncbi:ATP-dependent nuclease [Methanohalophilus mahii]|uniref:ATP-dependent endonuclease of the OLD family n=1 Tax=Methanohalophilus mahii (strain ATCC 35705 / DSM 5219 / SLP) TaxID=547558 RepID=D5EBL2_METMS|nr:AAA family ATPase [Methanohalophilus mahii]ADE36563.1 ATP-dependent endonuclease of the OLD family [Methanohalophilus mahii DSM 5219]